MKKVALILMLMTMIFLLTAETMTVHTTSGDYTFELTEIESIVFSPVAVQEDFIDFISKVPIRFLKNYPNPFNPITTISFELSQKGKTLVEIFNAKGQKVKTLLNEELDAGVHKIIWRGLDKQNNKVASGVYFYKVSVNNKENINKMIMLK